MQMTPVKSSNVESVGHDGNTLAITFKGGKTYYYPNVPTSVHQSLLKAKSIGSFITTNIINKYKHEIR